MVRSRWMSTPTISYLTLYTMLHELNRGHTHEEMDFLMNKEKFTRGKLTRTRCKTPFGCNWKDKFR